MYPTTAWVRHTLKGFNGNAGRRFYGAVLAAFIIGSEARPDKEVRPDSDLDVAVVIKRQAGASSGLKFSEYYHQSYRHESWKPLWKGRVVDFQFFYIDESELDALDKIPLEKA